MDQMFSSSTKRTLRGLPMQAARLFLVLVFVLSVIGAQLVTPAKAAGACTTVSLAATADTWMNSVVLTKDNNYGAAKTLKLQNKGIPGYQGALLKWDLSQKIPAAATISSAALVLNVTEKSAAAFNLYDLKRAWVEGSRDGFSGSGASWNYYGAGSGNWDSVGAQGDADRNDTNLWTPGSVLNSTGSREVPLNSSGVAVLQAWLGTPSGNNGFTIQNYDNVSGDDLAFSSKEGSSAPQLKVTYCTPNITVSTTSLDAFSSSVGQASVEQSYSVTGSYLKGNIVIVPPANFEISETSGSGFVTTSLSLTPSNGVVNSTTIYARLKSETAGAYAGSISHASTGATAQNVAVSGTVSTCYTLTVSQTGSGSTPAASPAKSAVCPLDGQYIAGETISLSGASPDADYYIGSWTGTTDDSSTAAANSLSMPASDHSVAVNYVVKGMPTLSMAGGPYTYDGASHTVTVSGSVEGTVSHIQYSGSDSAVNAGTYTITADFVPADPVHYKSLSGATAGTMAINQAALTITAKDAGKTYGEAVSFAGTEFTTEGLLGSDAVASVSLSSAGADAAAGVSGSPYAITASDATGSGLDNYTISYKAGSLAVSQAALTVTAKDAGKTYGEAVSFTGAEFTTEGLLLSDAVASVSLSSAGADAAAGVSGSPYAITAGSATGTGLDNYAIAYKDGSLTVNKAALTVTAKDAGKTYGEAVSFAGTEFTAEGLLLSDAVAGVSLSSAGADAAAAVSGSPYAITASDATGSGLDNYAIAYKDGSLTVNKAALTVTAKDAGKTYGEAVSFTGAEFTAEGLLGSDAVAGVSLSSAGADAAAAVSGSPYAITASDATGSGLDNYAISYKAGSLAVSQAALTVTAKDAGKTYGEAVNFAGNEFTAEGLLGSDTVAGVSLSSTGADAAAAVSGSPYAIIAGGATGSGLDNYAISYKAGSLAVSQAALTVTAKDASKTYGEAVSFAGTEFTAEGLLLSDAVAGVSLSSTGADAAAAVSGSPYAIVASGATGTGLDNYAIAYKDGSLTVNKAALTITAKDAGKTYGEAVSFTGTEFTAEGLLGSDAVTGVSLSSAGADAAAGVSGSPYAITAGSATGTGLDNYAIAYKDGSLTVNKAALTVTAKDAGKTYGEAVSFAGTEFTAEGLLGSDTVAGVSLSSAGADAAAGVSGSPYAITASDATGSGLDNYAIAYKDGSLTVSQAALTITAKDAGKTYGEAVSFAGTEFTTEGLLLSDAVASVSLSSAGTDAAAGVSGSPYAIIAGGATGTGLDNYAISYKAGSLTVGKAALTVTAKDASKTYGEAVSFAGTEFTAEGLLGSDAVASVSLSSMGADAAAVVSGSPYAIVAGDATGTGLDNYAIAYKDGSLTVNKAAQVINVTAHAPAEAANGSAFKVASEGGGSTNPVEITTSGACSGSGSNAAEITMTGASGLCTILFNQNGDSNYFAASEVTENVTATSFYISGSTGVGGVTLSFTGGADVVSGSDGAYSIAVPYGWNGSVTPSKEGYTFDPASRSYSDVKESKSAQDYTPAAITLTVRGNAGLGGVTLSFTGGADVVSAADGSYEISVPYGWSGSVIPSKEGYTFDPASRSYSEVKENKSAQDYTPAAITLIISGNAGLDGVTLSFTGGADVVSAADGSYTFTVPYGWSGTVTPFKAGYTFVPVSKSYASLKTDQSGQDYTAVQIPVTGGFKIFLPQVKNTMAD